jgi:predicted N-acetyltransferase YhbS
MIIRKPTAEDQPQLSAIWQEAFGDSPEDVENFYETAFSCDRALLAQEQNPVACIYWIDAQIDGQKIAYLYALAVEKTYRSQGVGKTLLQEALETLKGEGYKAAILVPGEESLYTYYEKAGFTAFGKTEKTTVTKKTPGLPVKKITPDAYFAKRQELAPAVTWGEEAVSYLGKLCDLYAGNDWLLALGREEVQEFIGNAESLPHILYTLNIEKTYVLAPGENPCAMACCFAKITLPDTFCPSF